MVRDYVKRYLDMLHEQERILNGTASDDEVLGKLTGLPPEAFDFIRTSRKQDVLAAKISRWWKSLPDPVRPDYVTMDQFQGMFGGDGIGAWQLGNALRELGWTSSRRLWKENQPRSRVWMPPVTVKVNCASCDLI